MVFSKRMKKEKCYKQDLLVSDNKPGPYFVIFSFLHVAIVAP